MQRARIVVGRGAGVLGGVVAEVKTEIPRRAKNALLGMTAQNLGPSPGKGRAPRDDNSKQEQRQGRVRGQEPEQRAKSRFLTGLSDRFGMTRDLGAYGPVRNDTGLGCLRTGSE